VSYSDRWEKSILHKIRPHVKFSPSNSVSGHLEHQTLHVLTALHCTTLHCTALHYTALHCTTLHYTAPGAPDSPRIAPACRPPPWEHCAVNWALYTALHSLACTALCTVHCTALHCTALHCTALCTIHCTTLHCLVCTCTASGWWRGSG
jgi:hypothetical protein